MAKYMAQNPHEAPQIDVPTGKKWGYKKVFDRMVARRPAGIEINRVARGQTHNGRSTSWVGGYETYEVYDSRRPEHPTAAAEDFADRVGEAFSEHRPRWRR